MIEILILLEFLFVGLRLASHPFSCEGDHCRSVFDSPGHFDRHAQLLLHLLLASEVGHMQLEGTRMTLWQRIDLPIYIMVALLDDSALPVFLRLLITFFAVMNREVVGFTFKLIWKARETPDKFEVLGSHLVIEALNNFPEPIFLGFEQLNFLSNGIVYAIVFGN